MANTIREQIILKVLARLAVITVANGYNTGIGAHVLRCRKKPDQSTELPCVVCWPLSETAVTDQEYGSEVMTMPVRIEALVEHGSTAPSVIIEQLLGDLRKCISTEPKTITSWATSLVSDVRYVQGGTEEYPNEGDKVSAAFAVFEIEYRTDLGNPYAQN